MTESAAPAEPREFALQPPRAPLGLPMMAGVLAGFSLANTLVASGLGEPAPAIAGLLLALVVGTFTFWLVRLQLPDGLRITSQAIELLRGQRTLRRVELARLCEVNQLPTPGGWLLLVSDHRHTIAVAAAQLAEPRQYDDLSQLIVAAVERVDPTGNLARQAVQAGRLRESVAQQPLRAMPVILGVVALSSLAGFGGLTAIAGRPFPLEALGALSTPLLQAGETFRLFSYPFLHVTPAQLLYALLGILWLGLWLEKLLGWERLTIAFAAGTLGTSVFYSVLEPIAPLTGAAGPVLGFVGAALAIAVVGRHKLPRALLPRPAFWFLTLLYVAVLVISALEAASLDRRLASVETLVAGPLLSNAGGALFGFIATLLSLAGTSLPAGDDARRTIRPFAVLAGIALLIGLAGSATHVRRDHANDDEILTLALLSLPASDWNATRQNNIAYDILTSTGAGPDSIDIASRLAQAAVDRSTVRSPTILDTLAVAKFKQGDSDAARELLEEALKLVPSGPAPADVELRRVLERRLRDVTAGGPLTPDSEK